jgi:hypothetical protein
LKGHYYGRDGEEINALNTCQKNAVSENKPPQKTGAQYLLKRQIRRFIARSDVTARASQN